MRCPKCLADDTKVIDSREAEEGTTIRRRRQCLACSHRFTTYERAEEVPLVVVKSNGQREPFDRAKLVAGVAAACKGRPVSAEQIDQLGEAIEDEVRLQGPEVATQLIGVEVLDRLRLLDEVAYLRFASVYKGFDAAADFQRELVLLKKLQGS
ncbi:MAG: transcriptional regulator NrdR [Actinomycetota bacterium]|nr:transcriptional regulator NrdR [Actinomycetota bacterium]